MSEFIGSRISLISKSDIRYVGTLHEINSESSTVALEQVTSYGTEGRRGDPAEEVAASNELYEYIVFRGSDVKDLRIEEAPQEVKPPPPQVPNDPAILGTGSRPPPQHPAHSQPPPQGPRQGQPPQFQPPPPYPYQQFGPYQQQRFGGPPGGPGPGFQGPPGGFQGYPGMPYGAPPPGWYPPPGQGFPQPPGPFSSHHQMPPPYGGSGLQPGQQQQGGPPKPATPQAAQAGALTSRNDSRQPAANSSAAPSKPKSSSNTPTPMTQIGGAPPPPVDSKPDTAAALAPPAQAEAPAPPMNAPVGPKSGRIVPAVPFTSPAAKPTPKAASKPTPTTKQVPVMENNQSSSAQSGQAAANAALQYQNATQAATAAVAAAMAKLPPMDGQAPRQANQGNAIDNLTRKVNEMRTDDRIRHSRQPGTGGYATGQRGGRGGRGRGGRELQGKTLEVPSTDFDFASANAQFNKQDLVKEAIATGSPAETPTESGADAPLSNGQSATNGTSDVVIPGAAGGMYNKSSFFDNISSEAKDREDAADGKRGGQEFRSEERRRNMETFGLGSVDGGYRGGFRGRGRGRGSRGGYARGGVQRGGYRGGRGEDGAAAASAVQYAGGL